MLGTRSVFWKSRIDVQLRRLSFGRLIRYVSSAFIVPILLGLLGFQVFDLIRSRQDVMPSFAVESLASRTDFLESEIQSKNAPSQASQVYRIINLTDRKIELFVRSKSCGCLSTSIDGQTLNSLQSWTLNAGAASMLALSFALPEVGQSKEVAMVLAAREPGNSDKKYGEKFLRVRSGVYRDIDAHPSVLQVLPPVGDRATMKLVEVTIVRSVTTASQKPDLKVVLPREIRDHYSLEVTSMNRRDRISHHLVRERFLVTLHGNGNEIDPNALTPTTAHMVVSFSDHHTESPHATEVPIHFADYRESASWVQ